LIHQWSCGWKTSRVRTKLFGTHPTYYQVSETVFGIRQVEFLISRCYNNLE